MAGVRELIEKAKEASLNAYAPYSGFRVGAALESASGKVWTGCNVENASYGLTMCAERVAVFKAVSEGVATFKRIVIYSPDSEDFITPCGACRQVLAEFDDGNMEVVMCNSKGVFKTAKLSELLPMSFSI